MVRKKAKMAEETLNSPQVHAYGCVNGNVDLHDEVVQGNARKRRGLCAQHRQGSDTTAKG